MKNIKELYRTIDDRLASMTPAEIDMLISKAISTTADSDLLGEYDALEDVSSFVMEALSDVVESKVSTYSLDRSSFCYGDYCGAFSSGIYAFHDCSDKEGQAA